MIKKVFPYGTVEIEDPKNGNVIKVNGHSLKLFLEGFEQELEAIQLDDLGYSN